MPLLQRQGLSVKERLAVKLRLSEVGEGDLFQLLWSTSHCV